MSVAELVLDESALARPALPYPGLRPFLEEETRIFFGRELETGEVLARLERQQLVVVHGASGCGKSSVVRAGVLPTFRRDVFASGRKPLVIVVTPSDEEGPLAALAAALSRELPLDDEPAFPSDDKELSQGLSGNWLSLLVTSSDWSALLREKASQAGATLALVIDQFEEVFALHRAGRCAEVERLIEFLIELDEPAPEGTALGERPLSVILTMRSDYLGHCALWDGFAETINRAQYLLPKISRVGLLRAIHQPALRYGGSIDATVANHLVPVMASNLDGLPILQHALMRAWQIAEPTDSGGRAVTLQHLNQIGSVAQALSWHAEEAFERATGNDPAKIEATEWMFRSLSDLDADLRIIRRSVSFDQLIRETGADPEVLGSIIDVFRHPDFSFLCPLGSAPLDGDTIVSVTHEALLRQWDRISERTFDGRFKGLVFREFADGMIWRSLSVQADERSRHASHVLGAAATEQRLPWFKEISKRPGWAARYSVRTGPDDKAGPQERWDKVAALMKASEVNLRRELGMIRQLRRTRMILIGLAALLGIAAGVVAWTYVPRALRAEETVTSRTEQAREILDAQLPFATQMAERVCEGRSLSQPELETCVLEEGGRLLGELRAAQQAQLRCQQAGGSARSCDLESQERRPMSPLGGGLVNSNSQTSAGESR